jgi:hypothetical protein
MVPGMNGLRCWCVLRTDDNGVSNVFARDLDLTSAEKLSDCMNELGHKQFYDAVLINPDSLRISSYNQEENITVLDLKEQSDGRHTIIFQQNGQCYSQPNAGFCVQGAKMSNPEGTYFMLFFEVPNVDANQANPLEDR